MGIANELKKKLNKNTPTFFFINDDEVFSKTEEFSPCEGDHYKLEVASDHYNLHWMFKGEYLLLYRFSRDNNTSKSSMLH